MTNYGVEAATNVSFTLQHSPNATFLNSSLGNCTSGATIECDMGVISAGMSIPITYYLQIPPDVTGVLTTSVSVAAAEVETIMSNNTATVEATIAPLPTVGFSQISQSVYENVPTATVTVTLDVAPMFTVTVDVDVVGGTAVSNTDYILLTPKTVTFSSGIITQTIVITIINNENVTAARTLDLQLSQQVNAVLGQASTQLIILDDDEVTYQSFLPFVGR